MGRIKKLSVKRNGKLHIKLSVYALDSYDRQYFLRTRAVKARVSKRYKNGRSNIILQCDNISVTKFESTMEDIYEELESECFRTAISFIKKCKVTKPEINKFMRECNKYVSKTADLKKMLRSRK